MNENALFSHIRVLVGSNIPNNIKDKSEYKKIESFLEVVAKIVGNIVVNPEDRKFRKLKCENSLVKNKVLSITGSELLLNYLGFEKCMVPVDLNNASKVVNSDMQPREPAFLLDNTFNITSLNSFLENWKVFFNNVIAIDSPGKVRLDFHSCFLFPSKVTPIFGENEEIESIYRCVENITPPKYRSLYNVDNIILVDSAQSVLEDHQAKIRAHPGPKLFFSTVQIFRKSEEGIQNLYLNNLKEFQREKEISAAKLEQACRQKWLLKEREKKETIRNRINALAEFRENRENVRQKHERLREVRNTSANKLPEENSFLVAEESGSELENKGEIIEEER